MSIFVKICGLSDEKHVHAAIDAGADAVGFVFAKTVREI
jgi:phosphoribosylanthranilate isomerase